MCAWLFGVSRQRRPSQQFCSNQLCINTKHQNKNTQQKNILLFSLSLRQYCLENSYEFKNKLRCHSNQNTAFPKEPSLKELLRYTNTFNVIKYIKYFWWESYTIVKLRTHLAKPAPVFNFVILKVDL